MWDTVPDTIGHTVLAHAMSCQRCGHELHVFVSCGDGCECAPAHLPGHRQELAIAG